MILIDHLNNRNEKHHVYFLYFSNFLTFVLVLFQGVKMAAEPKVALELKKKLFLDLIEEFQCYICKALPSTTVTKFYRCMNHHLVCAFCLGSKSCCEPPQLSCPQCSRKKPPLVNCCADPYGYSAYKSVTEHQRDDYKECTLVQKILKQWQLLVCIFYKNGCREINFKNVLLEHQKECNFRDIKCPDITCLKMIPFTSFADHMRSNHGRSIDIEMEYGTKTNFKRSIPTTFKTLRPKLISLNGLTFIEMWYNKDNTMYVWIYLLGDPIEAQRFQYHIHLKKEFGKEFTFFGKVKSINEGYRGYGNILKDENTCVTSTEMIKRYLNDMGQLEYTLKIRNLKEEVKDDNCESGIDDSD